MWGLLCNSHHSLWRPNYPEPSGSSGLQPGPCLKTRNNPKWTKHTAYTGKRHRTLWSADCLTFKEVYGLEHVSFGDSIVFRSFEKHGDLLHLLKCHAGALDGLDGLVGSIQAVDELRQHLKTQKKEDFPLNIPAHNADTIKYVFNPTLTHPSLSQFWKPVLPASGRSTPEHWAMSHSTNLSSSSGSYFLSILLCTSRLKP